MIFPDTMDRLLTDAGLVIREKYFDYEKNTLEPWKPIAELYFRQMNIDNGLNYLKKADRKMARLIKEFEKPEFR